VSIKIYTKTGDKGKTSLIGGTKVFKSNIRIEAYGTVDELNSYIGVVNDSFVNNQTNTNLELIQNKLFVIGSLLSCDPDKDLSIKLPDINEDDILFLENEIDLMNFLLPEMKNFILPRGHISISHTHVARCICRRAERRCVAIQQDNSYINPLILKYLNRLSDYLFVLARFIGFSLNISEIPWNSKK
jgi:cob(I)alamin adenosyltransferase